MPIEVKELHIKVAMRNPQSVIYVKFLPNGAPLRTGMRQFPDPAAFAEGLRKSGVPSTFRGSVMVVSNEIVPAHGAAAKPGSPSPVPIPYPVTALPAEMMALEAALRRSGYPNVTLKRGMF